MANWRNYFRYVDCIEVDFQLSFRVITDSQRHAWPQRDADWLNSQIRQPPSLPLHKWANELRIWVTFISLLFPNPNGFLRSKPRNGNATGQRRILSIVNTGNLAPHRSTQPPTPPPPKYTDHHDICWTKKHSFHTIYRRLNSRLYTWPSPIYT